MYIKDIDDVISIGALASNYSYYKNRNNEIKISIFSFAPVLFSWLGMDERIFYGYVGSGIYHWTQPSSSSFDSTSATEFGFRMGSGLKIKLGRKTGIGLNLEWNHIFKMKSKNFDIGPVNNIDLSMSFIYSFY